MSALTEIPSVDRTFFAATADAFLTLGFDVAEACARHGMHNPFSVHGDRLPLESISRIYDVAEAELADPEFIYKLPLLESTAPAQLLFDLISCCATPLAMLKTICRYSAIASDAVRFEFLDHGSFVHVRLLRNDQVYVSILQLEVSALLLLLGFRKLHMLAGFQFFYGLDFSHAPRFSQEKYNNYFGGQVGFNAPYSEITVRADFLRENLPGFDERRLIFYQAQAERYEVRALADGNLVQQVQLLFTQRMAFGEPDSADIAAALNLSQRTLQRRLQESGSSWRDATDQARLRVALHELNIARRPVQEIALRTGYSDTRAFLRAFRRWTGKTPSEMRNNVPA